LESDEVAVGAVDCSVERLNADLVPRELVQLREDVHCGGRRVDGHLAVVRWSLCPWSAARRRTTSTVQPCASQQSATV